MPRDETPNKRQPIRDGRFRIVGKYVPYISVKARYSGVRGIIITEYLGPIITSDRAWTLAHQATGRQLGDRPFSTIAEARRAAKRLEPLFDWDQTAEATLEAIRTMDSATMERLRGAIWEEHRER